MILIRLEVKTGRDSRVGAAHALTDFELDHAVATAEVIIRHAAEELMQGVATRLCSLEGPGRDCAGDRVLVEARLVPGIGMAATRETVVVFPFSLVAGMPNEDLEYARLVRRMIAETVLATRPPNEKAPA